MEASKRFQIKHNVTLRVIDKATGKLIREHTGHNSATNTMIEGVGHYLAGEGVLQQGPYMLSDFIPRYISLGTMGLVNQDETSEGLPEGISGHEDAGTEAANFSNYLKERPGYGSDGYSLIYNNNRPYLGLGPAYTSFSSTESYPQGSIVTYKGVAYQATEDIIIDPDIGLYNYWDSDKWEVLPDSKQPTCYELISPSAPRVEISFRDVVPEYEAEVPKSIDVIFSAMISTGALAEFRETGKDYIFISEAGLWSTRDYHPDGTGVNGLVAGYRLVPPKSKNWYMVPLDVPDAYAIDYLEEQGITDPSESQIFVAKTEIALDNRKILQEQILRVERNQIVQVIWKVQIGNIDRGVEGMSYISQNIQDQLDELYALVGNKVLFAESAIVTVAKWTNSGRSDAYKYQATVTVPGVDDTYFSMVQFKDADAYEYTFAPISRSSTDKIYIYCTTKPNRAIILPLIVCYKGTQVQPS